MSNSGKVLKINRNEISKRLKINGLNVRSEALSLMESELLNGYPNYQSIDEFISLITNILVINCDTNWFIIDAKTAQKAIDILRESRICKTVDNQLLVKNVLTDCDNHSITNNYLHHFHQLFESLNKHKLFAQSNHKLTKIDDLITSSHDLNCIVFGFLFKDSTKISRYLIEDSSGRVPVVFTEETQWRDDIMVENSFVLIEGNYDSQEDCLHVNEIGLTPPTDINTTINVSNGLSRLGRMIVIISDIHLNDEKTINKLKALFTGYNSMVPIPDCFLFVGDFLSKQCTDVSDFKAHMKNFVKLISTFNKIAKNSQFIFVPGFNDLSGNNIPKPQFPIDMFPTSTTKISNYYLATNPVNIYIDGRHICLSAFPLISKLKTHIIYNNTESSSDFGASIAKIVLSNAHLTPGVNKSFKSSLSLFHSPDLLLLTDYNIEEEIDCQVYDFVNLVNLPSFSNNEFKFKVFYTNPKQIEDSQILV